MGGGVVVVDGGHLMRRLTLTAYRQRGMRSEAGRKGSMIPADPW